MYHVLSVVKAGRGAKEQPKERELDGIQRQKTPVDKQNECILDWKFTLKPMCHLALLALDRKVSF